MNLLPPPFSRINRVVLVIGIVCLVTTFAGVIFVAARNDEHSFAATDTAPLKADESAKARVADRFGRLPLSFEVNKGQTDQSVKFLSRGPGYDLFLTANEAVVTLRKPQRPDAADKKVREGSVLRLKMIGANSAPQVEGQDELPGKVNYFAGSNPQKWLRNIPTYRKVYYKNVYPGIDVVYYGNQREFEYDFVVAPGANPKVIKFTVEGADKISLDKTGNLLLNLKHGEVSLKKPVIYQLTAEGNRSEVKGHYQIKGNEVRFKVEGYDSGKPLVIDPVLSYSTFLGGGGSEHALSIAVDSQGSAYVTGPTDRLFPTTAGAFKTTSQSGGAFVSKLDPTGSTLVYSTYLSDGGTTGKAIAVDASGNAYVTGTVSTETDFPAVNALRTSSNLYKTTDSAANWRNNNTGIAGNVTAIAFSPSSPNIMYAGGLGGPYKSTDGGTTWTKTPTTGISTFPQASAMAVDPNNSSVVYVAFVNGGLHKTTDGGNTWSPLQSVPFQFFPVFCIAFDPLTPSTMYVGTLTGAFKSTDSGATWTELNFGTGFPPNVRALAIDPTTPSTIYAGTLGSKVFKSTNGGSSWTTMNSGLAGGSVLALAIDPSNPGTVYAGLDTPNGIGKSTNGAASWTSVNTGVPTSAVTSFVVTPAAVYASTDGAGVIKTTDGGTSWTSVNTGLGSSRVPVLARHPTDSTIVFAGAIASNRGDAFVTKLNPSGSGLLFSTLLGGSSDDFGNDIAVDGNGNIYVAGETLSTNFPTANAFQSGVGTGPIQSCGTGFVTKLDPAAPSYVFSTYLGGNGCETVNSIALDTSGDIYVTGATDSTDFPTANAFQGTRNSGSDAFVTKLTTSGLLSYSTYLGGNSSDSAFGIAVDNSGNAYITGSTTSNNFPTLNPIQGTHGGFTSDAFVTKLSSQGSALVYSTYLGGSNFDIGRGIAVDSTGNAYITGITSSAEFPILAGALRTRSPLFKSLDGGGNWTNDNYGFRGSSITHIVINPSQPWIIYVGTGDGVFKSTDAGRNWSPANNGLNTNNRRVVGLVVDPLTPSTVYVAINDFFGGNSGIYKSTDGGNSWNLRKNGMTNTNVLSLAIDPVTPTTLYAGSGGSPIFKTTDGADNWAPTTSPSFGGVVIEVDPLNHTKVYAGETVSSGGGMFRSVDSGATWQSIGLDSTPRTINASPVVSGLLYAQTNGQGFFRSTDGGDNWTPVTSLECLSGKFVFDPVNPSTFYVLVINGCTAVRGLIKSTDNGQTWVPMNKGLPSLAVALAVNPQNPSILHLASSPPDGQDAFVTKINPAGSALVYSTFIGGTTIPTGSSPAVNAQGFAIAVDSSGSAYVTGLAFSEDFPVTPGSYQPFNRGRNDAFISKLSTSHIISGVVLDGSNVPVSGVEVALTDGSSVSFVTTEGDGTYQFSRLREGGSFTVSATKPHFTITPPSQAVNNLTSDQVVNFTATATNAPFFTISGKVSENGVGLAGATVTLSGSQPGVRITDSNGNYSFELAGGGNYTVTPSIVGFSFATPSQTFNNLSAAQTANFAATRQSFVVTNANSHGPGSLRDAIINANATAGADTIVFNIPGAGVKLIELSSVLPEIIDSVTIDGTTQPGYAGSPLIEVNGSFTGGDGLVIKATSTVKGLALGNFRGLAAIWIRDCDNNVIQGNYIGLDATGTASRVNTNGILLSNSSNNLIGGTTAAARNVISGNSFAAIELGGSGNIIQGNYIGTNAAGTEAVFNSSGIEISSSPFINNVIGGTVPGAGNLISGNGRGIRTNAHGTIIQGNLIGTDVTGTQAIPNGNGIEASGNNITVGGLSPAARNIISGNGNGVSLGGNGSTLQGNYIGTDITGTVALGNDTGVGAGNALVGGTVPGARNVIAGNRSVNLTLGFNSSGPAGIVRGNYIGTDVTGTKALSPLAIGISIEGFNHTIGGTTPGSGNLISGNRIGIQLGGLSSSGPQGNVIQGNLIGLDAAGTGAIPNAFHGIGISEATNTVIGGTASGAANKIAFNGGAGINVFSGSGNSIRGNGIFSNGGLGIDLVGNGVTANDATDTDTGANLLQNFPVLTSVQSSGGNTTIQGSLKSTPNTEFQIDFYTSTALDPSGNGEGALFFNTTSVTTNGSGDATINVTFSDALPVGRAITATATDPNGNTSEFSSGDENAAIGSLQFSLSSFFVIEDVGQATITVQRVGGKVGNLSVNFATSDGTAIAGQDYTATSGTLNFGNGETSKTFQVPITEDSTTEPDETFTIKLTAPTLEGLGAPTEMVVTIQDRTTVPFVFMNNASVVEGGPGTTTQMLFNLTLSAATGRTVSVSYATANSTAFGSASCGNQGTDYESVSGSFTFQPGQFRTVVPVKVCGDTSAEANEVFVINLSNVSNATLIPQATGTIVNDDVLELILEESGPGISQAAALDAYLAIRDPFRVLRIDETLTGVTDKNTRVVLFARNLQLNPGEAVSAVIVRLIGSNNQIFNVPAEDVRAVPGTEFTQVIIKLPETLPAGTCTLTVRAHGRISNIGSFRIVQ